MKWISAEDINSSTGIGEMHEIFSSTTYSMTSGELLSEKRFWKPSKELGGSGVKLRTRIAIPTDSSYRITEHHK